MNDQVTVTDSMARPTAVVPAMTTWQAFPALWRALLAEVWACLRAGGVTRGCRNIMLYWDDVPHVEVGVELLVPCPLTRPVDPAHLAPPVVPRSSLRTASGVYTTPANNSAHVLAGRLQNHSAPITV